MGYFMANFKTFDHLTALAMKKRISYFGHFFGLSM